MPLLHIGRSTFERAHAFVGAVTNDGPRASRSLQSSARFLFILLALIGVLLDSLPLGYASGTAPAPSGAPANSASPAPHSAAPAHSQANEAARLAPTRVIKLPEFAIFENVTAFRGQNFSTEGKNAKDAEALKPKENPFDHSQARYNVILALATWSERAKEVGKFFESRLPELKTRKISVVGVFTHDSYEDIARLAKEQGYSFALSKTDLNYVEKLLNPKIPTIWVTDHRGQVVYRLVRPTSEGIAKVYQYLLAWTDF